MMTETDADTAKLKDDLIFALNNSEDGLKLFQEKFKDVSEAFEVGKIAEAAAVLKEVLGPISEFSQFLADVLTTIPPYVSEESYGELTMKCERLESFLNEMLTEMEDENFLELGDIMRFDLGDLMKEFDALFPKLADEISASK